MNWISEKEASVKVNRKPRVLRRLVKTGKWPIDFTAPNGRTYQYSEQGINKMLLSFSSKIK